MTTPQITQQDLNSLSTFQGRYEDIHGDMDTNIEAGITQATPQTPLLQNASQTGTLLGKCITWKDSCKILTVSLLTAVGLGLAIGGCLTTFNTFGNPNFNDPVNAYNVLKSKIYFGVGGGLLAIDAILIIYIKCRKQ